MYKSAFWAILILFALTCSTSKKEKETALFIRICDNLGRNCQTYLPTNHSTVDTTSMDVVEFVENHSNVFFGEKSADYNFLSYLSKDTLTILIEQ